MKEWAFKIFLLSLACYQIGCDSTPIDDGPMATPSATPMATASPSPSPTPGVPMNSLVVFTPVGATLDGGLIDLEFLPGQNGDSIAITIDGNVYYLNSNFTPVGQPFSISVDQANEQGLLNVAADPDYNSNKYIYLYYTTPGNNPDINQVDRFTVDTTGGNFTLSDRVMIIQFDKDQSPNPGSNHNGGSMVFSSNRTLFIGVGDGGGSSSANQSLQIALDPALTLGKIHRIIPSDQMGVGSFTVPSEQPFTIPFKGSDVVAEDSVYSVGVRNPFTMVLEDEGDIFFGDVGESSFEEINCAYLVDAPENYGWPLCEGPCNPPIAGLVRPIHFYAHGDDTFDNEDPEDNPQGPQSIMVNAFYDGDAYGPTFKGSYGTIIYSEFFEGWIRLANLNAFDQVISTIHIGHQGGLTGLHENPADGLLYGTGLFSSDRILRMDLVQP